MRALALTYVTGMTPRPEFSAVCFNLVPTVGEYFVFPALTTTGACEIMVFEGVPGGPMDCWGDVTTPAEHLAKLEVDPRDVHALGGRALPHVELTDDNGILAGRFPPTVRKPVGRLPSGRAVLGMADAVVLNDPITGQGSNNAAKGAAVYLQSILERGEGPFDEAWMQETFERLWEYAEKVVGVDERAAPAAPAARARAARRRGPVPGRRAPLRERLRQPARLLRVVHGSRHGGDVPRRGRRLVAPGRGAGRG